MTETAKELRALAFIVAGIRPHWPETDIMRALSDDHRDFPELAIVAITAAKNPTTKYPAGIRTTYPGSDGCQKCAQRDKATAIPALDKCERCRHLTCTCNAMPMPATVRDFIAEDNLLATQQVPYRRRLAENPDDRESRQLLAALTERRDRLREQIGATHA